MPELPPAGTVPVAVTPARGEAWECVGTCCGVLVTESSLVWWRAVWSLLGFGSTVSGLLMLSYSSNRSVHAVFIVCLCPTPYVLLLTSVVHSPVPPAVPLLMEGICDRVHIYCWWRYKNKVYSMFHPESFIMKNRIWRQFQVFFSFVYHIATS